jgi:hypothetical protein
MDTETIPQEETQHEPHTDARRRVVIGGVALIVLVALTFTWFFWGTEIKDACFGEEVCKIDLPKTS